MRNKSKVIKLQSPFERIKKYSTCPEVNLYRAVIMQLVIDATNISKESSNVKNEQHAKELLFEESEDFAILCDNADLNKKEVRELAKKLINSQKAKIKS